MKRLLCIVGGMNVGGAETFLMKIYREIDRKRYQMDFAVAIKDKGYYDDEIISMGGKIYHITPKSSNPIKNFNDIKNIVKENSYNSVLRVSQNSLSALELFAAYLGGAKKRAYRSSNSNTTEGSKKQLLFHKIFMFMPKTFANIRFAPSKEAATFMFGKNSIKNKKAFILNNGIDYSKYRYSEEWRKKIRHSLNIEDDELLIGHIGRFVRQKNHLFLLDVFSEIKKRNNKSKLILIGEGEMAEEIKNHATDLKIINDIIFAGVRSDIPELLSAMDFLVFPSFYEGMPNVVIEAQAAGLTCVISDNITKEADISQRIIYKSLNEDTSSWAESVLRQTDINRKVNKIKEYDINYVAERFVDILF